MVSESDVNIKTREKIFPEEDYEYEGTVNGKVWKAKQTLGMGPMTSVYAPEGEPELSTEERKAVRDKINSKY